MPTPTLTPTTPVDTIDLTDDYWFNGAPSDKEIALPGKLRREADDNLLTRLQVKTILQIAAAEGVAGQTLADACDYLRGPQGAKLSKNQNDFNIVGWGTGRMSAATADMDLTASQHQLIATNIAALAGTTPHWNTEVAVSIKALPQPLKDRFLYDFLDCKTRGDLDHVLVNFNAIVGDPKRFASINAKTAAMQASVEALDITEPTPAPEDDPFHEDHVESVDSKKK